MNFAVIENNIVTNLIVADSKEIAESITGLTCVEYGDDNPARMGLGYDGVTFEQPPVGAPWVQPTEEEIAEANLSEQ
jgi:hypothetical protein